MIGCCLTWKRSEPIRRWFSKYILSWECNPISNRRCNTVLAQIQTEMVYDLLGPCLNAHGLTNNFEDRILRVSCKTQTIIVSLFIVDALLLSPMLRIVLSNLTLFIDIYPTMLQRRDSIFLLNCYSQQRRLTIKPVVFHSTHSKGYNLLCSTQHTVKDIICCVPLNTQERI